MRLKLDRMAALAQIVTVVGSAISYVWKRMRRQQVAQELDDLRLRITAYTFLIVDGEKTPDLAQRFLMRADELFQTLMNSALNDEADPEIIDMMFQQAHALIDKADKLARPNYDGEGDKEFLAHCDDIVAWARGKDLTPAKVERKPEAAEFDLAEEEEPATLSGDQVPDSESASSTDAPADGEDSAEEMGVISAKEDYSFDFSECVSCPGLHPIDPNSSNDSTRNQ